MAACHHILRHLVLKEDASRHSASRREIIIVLEGEINNQYVNKRNNVSSINKKLMTGKYIQDHSLLYGGKKDDDREQDGPFGCSQIHLPSQ